MHSGSDQFSRNRGRSSMSLSCPMIIPCLRFTSQKEPLLDHDSETPSGGAGLRSYPDPPTLISGMGLVAQQDSSSPDAIEYRSFRG
jgi:hypothetical protein